MTVSMYKGKDKIPLRGYIDFIARNTAMIVDKLEEIRVRLDNLEKNGDSEKKG